MKPYGSRGPCSLYRATVTVLPKRHDYLRCIQISDSQNHLISSFIRTCHLKKKVSYLHLKKLLSIVSVQLDDSHVDQFYSNWGLTNLNMRPYRVTV